METERTGMAYIYTQKCEEGATETTPGSLNFNKVTKKYKAQVMEWLNADGYYVTDDGKVFKAATVVVEVPDEEPEVEEVPVEEPVVEPIPEEEKPVTEPIVEETPEV